MERQSIPATRSWNPTGITAPYGTPEYDHQYYLIKQDAYKQKRLEHSAKRDALKDVPCADCGRRFPAECMDFDHVNGDKRIDVSKNRLVTPRVLEEIAKCEVVCACCHRTRTRNRGQHTTWRE